MDANEIINVFTKEYSRKFLRDENFRKKFKNERAKANANRAFCMIIMKIESTIDYSVTNDFSVDIHEIIGFYDTWSKEISLQEEVYGINEGDTAKKEIFNLFLSVVKEFQGNKKFNYKEK